MPRLLAIFRPVAISVLDNSASAGRPLGYLASNASLARMRAIPVILLTAASSVSYWVCSAVLAITYLPVY